MIVIQITLYIAMNILWKLIMLMFRRIQRWELGRRVFVVRKDGFRELIERSLRSINQLLKLSFSLWSLLTILKVLKRRTGP